NFVTCGPFELPDKVERDDSILTLAYNNHPIQDEGISWIPQEEEVHEKLSDETEVLIQEETPTDIIEEHGSGEKGKMEISTANIQVSTASPPKVNTVVPHVYKRRSAKDKGKAIMEEPATPKKVKKRTQAQLSMNEELARKMEEEERIRFNAEQEARALQEEEEERLNLEAARELQRQLDQRHEVPTQPTQSQGIDWNDPSVLRYHALKNRPVSIAQARRNMITYLKNQGGYKESYFKKMSYDDIRPIFERVWDHVNTFIPIGSEVEKDSSKPSEKETSKTVEEEKVEEEDVNPEPVLIEKKAVGIRRKTLARRRASDKQGQDSSKRQKKEKETTDYEEEKDELRMWLTVVLDEEAIVDPEVLHTKFPIVDWESQSLGNMHVYKIIRAYGNTSYHKTSESMLKSFDRHDLEVSHMPVMERFQDNTPEGYNLMLWGDLKILGDPEQDDDIWKNQNQWKLISWKLFETCGVHILMVDEILKKYGMKTYDPVGTPMEIIDKFDLDKNETLVDATKYHSMIGALMYLTSSRPDIVHATCLCARYQAKPTEKHLKEVEMIFCYLRGTVNMGLWYTKDSGFKLTGFLDANYAGCQDSFKSTSDGTQFLGKNLVGWSSKMQDCTALSTAEAEYVSLSACCA
ncbi:hypothetical protein Tco_0004039, partial [Tanacetum coccineum]